MRSLELKPDKPASQKIIIDGNKMIKMEIETLKLIPADKKIKVEFGKNKFRIKYLSRGKGGSNSKEIILPKTIELTAEIISSLGIYYAEGNKSERRRLSSFVNSNQTVIKEGIKLFKALGISENKLKARVKVYKPTISSEKLKKYWSKITAIPKENFIKTEIMKSESVYQRKRKRPSPFGELEIFYSSVVIKDLIDNLLNKVKKWSLTNPLVRREFLRGLIAGEGSVKLVNNKLRELRISSTDKLEQQFIRNLLLKENIKPSKAEYDFYIAISGYDNFNKISELALFNLHPDKKQDFFIGFRNLKISDTRGISERHQD